MSPSGSPDVNEIGLLESGAGAPGAFEARLERAVFERAQNLELERAQTLAVAAALVWLAFGAFDYFAATKLELGPLAHLMRIRVGIFAALVVFAAASRLVTYPRPALVDAAVIAGAFTMAAGLGGMAALTGGLSSLYAAGLPLVLAALLALPRAFPRGGLYAACVLVGYPVGLYLTAHTAAGEAASLAAPASLVQFTQLGLICGVSWALVSALGHVFDRMHRELTESRSAGRYRLLRSIGKGGMGEVWAAYHHGLRREVAVKILRLDAAEDAAGARRFEREIHAMAGLKHPNTVRLLDFGISEDGRLYYAMELLEGATIRSIVRNGGAISVDRALELVAQAADALAEAHASQIVHRDVKSENLFVTKSPEGRDFLKVLDFGVASVLDDPSFVVTRTGSVSGTPGTMSPEVILGQPTTAKADIYALGVVLYFMVTGTMPFGEGTGPQLLVAQVRDELVPPSKRATQFIPREVEDIIIRAMAKDPKARFADAAEMASALRRAKCSPVAPRSSLIDLPTSPVPGSATPRGTLELLTEPSQEIALLLGHERSQPQESPRERRSETTVPPPPRVSATPVEDRDVTKPRGRRPPPRQPTE